MTAITWVVAADGKRARVFETHGLTLDLRQVEDLRNPAASMTDDDSAAFARKVAAFLEDSRRQHRFDRLRLAVEPRFLNVLRAHLTSDTRLLVYEETADDASHDLRHGLGRR
ncbi:host attachment protein [Caballeronia sp. LZ034LL]|uniref:host attachment protein n=1 Tax=Caballeronia sp. LZ034LL TaxID=3038567 RepID=UPI00285EBDDE|nr:host attachment protein [Caballeronia sp. LZ034LL]MDR5838463.1 host attachment protein [Caballeronia sp. LZ034LL]